MVTAAAAHPLADPQPLPARASRLACAGAAPFGVGALLVACHLVDRRLYPGYGVAQRLTLRFRLSAIAAFSCFIGAAGS